MFGFFKAPVIVTLLPIIPSIISYFLYRKEDYSSHHTLRIKTSIIIFFRTMLVSIIGFSVFFRNALGVAIFFQVFYIFMEIIGLYYLKTAKVEDKKLESDALKAILLSIPAFLVVILILARTIFGLAISGKYFDLLKSALIAFSIGIVIALYSISKKENKDVVSSIKGIYKVVAESFRSNKLEKKEYYKWSIVILTFALYPTTQDTILLAPVISWVANQKKVALIQTFSILIAITMSSIFNNGDIIHTVAFLNLALYFFLLLKSYIINKKNW